MPRLTRRAVLLAAAGSAIPWRASRAQSAPPAEATRFIQKVGQELPAVVAGAQTAADKRDRIIPFLERVAALDDIARFCLGRYWRQATPEQQQAYLRLFVRALATAIATRVDVYKVGQDQIRYLPELAVPEGTLVPTVVSSPGQSPVNVSWLVDTAHRPFRILDVTAEGVSARLTLRSDYTSFLSKNNGDVALFLQTLQSHLS